MLAIAYALIATTILMVSLFVSARVKSLTLAIGLAVVLVHAVEACLAALSVSAFAHWIFSPGDFGSELDLVVFNVFVTAAVVLGHRAMVGFSQ